MNIQDNEILHLICRYLANECTAEEKNTVERWIADKEEHRTYFEAIKKVWDVKPSHDVDVDFEEEWERIKWRLGIKSDESELRQNVKEYVPGFSRYEPLKYVLQIAAIILLVAVTAIYFVDFHSKSNDQSSKTKRVVMQKVKTARGEKARMEFSDGSQIVLNSMSTVRFPKVFNGRCREVYLDGEAFFRITHNKKMPFIVHSKGVEIKVLGTEFNVNAYADEKDIEVVVRNGKVAVKQSEFSKKEKNTYQQAFADKEANRTVILTEGQKTIVKIGELPSKPQKVSLLPYLAWINGRMVFEGAPMREVIPRLQRAYRLNFEVQDSSLLSEQLKASFKRESPEKVLEIIAFSLGIKYKRHGDTVIFKYKKETRNEQKTQPLRQ